MSSDNNDDKRKYAVGRGRPPEAARFKKGVSGNPAGRPLGSKNRPPRFGDNGFQKLMKKVANSPTEIREGGETKTISVIEGLIRRVCLEGLKGDRKAAQIIFEHMKAIEEKEAAERKAYCEALIEYKYKAYARIEEYKKAGLEPPKMIPNPDHIIIDTENDDVTLEGPMCEEEVPLWENKRKAQRVLDIFETVKAMKDKENAGPLLYEAIELVTELEEAGLMPPLLTKGSPRKA